MHRAWRPSRFSSSLLLAAAGGALFQVPGVAALQGPPRGEERQGGRSWHGPLPTAPDGGGVSATGRGLPRREAVDLGLAFVASRMGRDGSFDLSDALNPAPVAVTALAALALMADGHFPGRSPLGDVVERGLLYLLAHQDRTGGPRHGYISSEGDGYSKMHGHGFATLALAEAYGMVGMGRGRRVHPAALREALVAAVRCIERSQEAETGGWYYDPVPHGHEGSVTICVVQALRAARNAGVQVDSEVIDRAVDYVRRSQKPDGSFRYALGSEDSTGALTAAAISTLNATGDYDSEIIDLGIAFLDRSEPDRRLRLRMGPDAGQQFPYYERLYMAQAYFQYRERDLFERWFPGEADHLVGHQREDGSWRSRRYGSVYATSMSLLALLIPQQLLPIFQR